MHNFNIIDLLAYRELQDPELTDIPVKIAGSDDLIQAIQTLIERLRNQNPINASQGPAEL